MNIDKDYKAHQWTDKKESNYIKEWPQNSEISHKSKISTVQSVQITMDCTTVTATSGNFNSFKLAANKKSLLRIIQKKLF